MSDQARCSGCQAEVSPDAVNCPRCGRMLKRGAKLVACPDCGHQISTRALACPSCGRRVAFGTVIASAIFWTLLVLLVFVWFVVALMQAVSWRP